jgi:hypothetical protein
MGGLWLVHEDRPVRSTHHRTTTAPRPAVTGLERDLVTECCQRAEDMGANLEVCGQRNLKGSGTTMGAPDATLFASGWSVPIEFKREGRIASEDGKLRLDQQARIYDRLQQGVQTAVIYRVDEFGELVNWCRRNARRQPTMPFAPHPE